jgi:hypothetical protein
MGLTGEDLTIPLEQLAPCFQGIIPSILATASREGITNIIPVSYTHLVDAHHVALSRQFFRKTHANLLENPSAQLIVMDPHTRESYRLVVRFDHEERSGPLFDLLSARLDVVAARTGMTGVFALQAATIFEVLSVEWIPGVVRPAASDESTKALPAANDAATQLRALRSISDCLRSTDEPDDLLDETLRILEEILGFEHSMILLVDESGDRLYTIASRGYPESGVGAEVRVGDGVIGTVARTRKLVRVASVSRDLAYGRAMRAGAEARPVREVPLPGLADAQSQLAIPLVVKDELLGVLAVESRELLAYSPGDEACLDVVAAQVALVLRDLHRPEEPAEAAAAGQAHRFLFYRSDDCVFVDGQYLIRNVPGRILWKLLRAFVKEGRSDFTNRELRLDPSLGLPALRDNLESRLILLRKRLVEKCPNVSLVSRGRGRFGLEVRCALTLDEKD